jgi:hypothetical protein
LLEAMAMIVIGVDVCACSLSWSIVRGQELRNEAFWPIFVLGVSGASRERARADRPRPRRPADAVVFPAFCDTFAASCGIRKASLRRLGGARSARVRADGSAASY